MIDFLLRRHTWRRCRHRSHLWPHRRTCLRGLAYNSFCHRHNEVCWWGCTKAERARRIQALNEALKTAQPRYVRVKPRKKED